MEKVFLIKSADKISKVSEDSINADEGLEKSKHMDHLETN